jgi:hypothetical protein
LPLIAKNYFQRLGPKKRGVLFYVTCAAKNLEGRYEVARQPIGDTSNAATVAVTKCDVSLLMEKLKNICSN